MGKTLTFHKKLLSSIIIFAPLFYLGIGNKYPWILLGKYGQSVGVLCFFIMTVIFLLYNVVNDEVLFSKLQRIFYLNLLLSLLFVIFYDLIQYRHFSCFGYKNPVMLFICTIVAIVFIVVKRDNIRSIFVACGLYSILHTVFSLYYFPLATARSDMLPAIHMSLHQFVVSASPYVSTSSAIGIPPYLPVTMLSFLPAYFFQIDFRIIGLLYSIITFIIIWYKFNVLSGVQRFGLCLFFVNPYFLMRHDLYFQFFLLELVILCLYFDKFRIIYQVIFLGIFVATLQFAWILLPFILLANFRRGVTVINIAILVMFLGAIISFVYVHVNINDFIHAIFLHKEYKQPYSSDITFGLSTIFYFTKSQVVLYLIQVTGCLIMICYALYNYVIMKIRGKEYYLSLGAICYLFFMVTNYFIETYLLMPMIIFLILSITSINQNIRSKYDLN